MNTFTQHGQNVVADLSQRYQLSRDSTIQMIYAVSNGGGTMAQFNCPELGGGQWMQGGMTMVSDMFNNALKMTVENLCCEISNLLFDANAPLFAPVERVPPQRGQQQSQGNGMGQNSLFIPGHGGGNWWGDDLGMASSTGGQNNVRYAVFPETRRLAIEVNGCVTLYDTLDHQIGGVSQQQSGDASVSFSSQYGLIYVSELPVVSADSQAQQSQPVVEPAPIIESVPEPMPQSEVQPAFEARSMLSFQDSEEQGIFDKIERLAGLKEKGILTEEEFSLKKAELLDRL